LCSVVELVAMVAGLARAAAPAVVCLALAVTLAGCWINSGGHCLLKKTLDCTRDWQVSPGCWINTWLPIPVNVNFDEATKIMHIMEYCESQEACLASKTHFEEEDIGHPRKKLQCSLNEEKDRWGLSYEIFQNDCMGKNTNDEICNWLLGADVARDGDKICIGSGSRKINCRDYDDFDCVGADAADYHCGLTGEKNIGMYLDQNTYYYVSIACVDELGCRAAARGYEITKGGVEHFEARCEDPTELSRRLVMKVPKPVNMCSCATQVCNAVYMMEGDDNPPISSCVNGVEALDPPISSCVDGVSEALQESEIV